MDNNDTSRDEMRYCSHGVPVASFAYCAACDEMYSKASHKAAQRLRETTQKERREREMREARDLAERRTHGRFNAKRLIMARESRGRTRSEFARATGIPYMRYKALEGGAFGRRVTKEELHEIARVSNYPAAFFYQADPPEFDMKQSSLMFHSMARICDVCERENGIDDERAITKCTACGLDLCDVHAFTYQVSVPLPHKRTEAKMVGVTKYCKVCYRRYIGTPFSKGNQGIVEQGALPFTAIK